jgi:hypothetical protein
VRKPPRAGAVCASLRAMTTPGGRAADVIAAIEAQTEATLAKLRRASSLREEVGAARGTGTCDGVTVTVNAAGVLLDVDFGHAGPQGALELRRRLLAAHRAAQRDVAATVGERARTVGGAEDPVVARLEADLALRAGPRLVPRPADDVSR